MDSQNNVLNDKTACHNVSTKESFQVLNTNVSFLLISMVKLDHRSQ